MMNPNNPISPEVKKALNLGRSVGPITISRSAIDPTELRIEFKLKGFKILTRAKRDSIGGWMIDNAEGRDVYNAAGKVMKAADKAVEYARRRGLFHISDYKAGKLSVEIARTLWLAVEASVDDHMDRIGGIDNL